MNQKARSLSMRLLLTASLGVVLVACSAQNGKTITLTIPGPTIHEAHRPVDSIVLKNVTSEEYEFLLCYGIVEADSGEKLDYVAEMVSVRPGEVVTKTAGRGRMFVDPKIKEVTKLSR